MRTFIALILTLVATVAVLAAQQLGCGNDCGSKPTPTPTPVHKGSPTPTPTPAPGCNIPPGPQNSAFMFGYLDDGIAAPIGDAVPETFAETNVCWINNGDGGDDLEHIISFQQRVLCEAIASSRKSVLEIDYVCFSGASLRPDWLARLSRYLDAVHPFTGWVAAFYVLDEPYELASAYRVPIATMRQQLDIVLGQLKSLYPAIPEAVICQGFTIDNSLVLPSLYDWIGLDFYADFSGRDTSGRGFQYYEQLLEQRLETHQRVILVPFAWANPGSLDQAIDRIQQATEYADWAIGHPRVTGMFPFIYQRVVGSPTNIALGVRDLPGLRSIYQVISARLRH